MKKLTLTLALTMLSYTYISAQSQSISGVWLIEKNNTKIEITEKGGVWSGKILSSDDKEAKIGNTILKDLKKNEDGVWEGSIYATKKKDWYDVEVEKEGDELELEISVGFFSKSLTWKKVNS